MTTPTDSSSHHTNLRYTALQWLGLSGVILVTLLVYGALSEARIKLSTVVGMAAVEGMIATMLIKTLQRINDLRTANGPNPEQELLEVAYALRATRERARAIYEMSTKLSSTLEYSKILEEAQNIGLLNLREKISTSTRIVSAVLLFQGADNKLRVITSRGLTPTDQNVAVEGQRGVLGLVMKQGEPVFGADAGEDLELRYYAGLQESKSVLAIPLGAGFDIYGVMIFGCDQSNAFTDDHLELMKAIGTQATVSLQNAVLYQNLAIEKEKIVEVEEDARKKLARDLHDGPTQSVAAIAMRANFIRRLIDEKPQQARDELTKVEDLARRTTKEIRHMLFTLRPLVLETQGLVAAIQQLAEKVKDTHGTTVDVQAKHDAETYLDTNAQGILFYIIEEAVNNARKHAESDKIWVRLYRRDDYVWIEVEDHGVGFDVNEMDAGYDLRGSLGMINMRERAELINGQLSIQSVKGKGTKITIRVPVDTSGVLGKEAVSAPPLELQSQHGVADDSFTQPITDPVEPLEPDDTPKRKVTHIKGAGDEKTSAERAPRVSRPRQSTIKPITRPITPPEPAPFDEEVQTRSADTRRQRFPSPRPVVSDDDKD